MESGIVVVCTEELQQIDKPVAQGSVADPCNVGTSSLSLLPGDAYHRR